MLLHLHIYTYVVYDMLYQLSQVMLDAIFPKKHFSSVVFQKSPPPNFLMPPETVGHQVVAYDAKQMQHGDAKGICLVTDGAQIV